MRKGIIGSAIIIAFLSLGVVSAKAGEPTDKIKDTTDKIIAIVSNPELKAPSRVKERRKLIREAVDERFDWEEMSRRSLGPKWGSLTPEQKKNFISLFGDLLERTYLERVESYSGEKVSYLSEKNDDGFSDVDVKILTKQNTEILVKYRLRKKGNDWPVYDISIAGASLVNNYRVQFSSILSKSSYDELVLQLQRKIAGENER